MLSRSAGETRPIFVWDLSQTEGTAIHPKNEPFRSKEELMDHITLYMTENGIPAKNHLYDDSSYPVDDQIIHFLLTISFLDASPLHPDVKEFQMYCLEVMFGNVFKLDLGPSEEPELSIFHNSFELQRCMKDVGRKFKGTLKKILPDGGEE